MTLNDAWIAAGSTLAGTLIGGFIAFLTLRMQLSHEARERERERKLSLRRDVYLAVAEAIGKSQTFLSHFSRHDADPSQLIELLQDIPSAINKSHLVASNETIRAISDYGEFLLSRTLELLTLKVEVSEIQGETNLLQADINRLESHRSYLLSVFGSLYQNDPLTDRVKADISDTEARLEQASAKMRELAHQNLEAVKKLGKETFVAGVDAQSEVGKVALAIRREIELPLVESWYLGFLSSRSARLYPRIDEAYRRIDLIMNKNEAQELPMGEGSNG